MIPNDIGNADPEGESFFREIYIEDVLSFNLMLKSGGKVYALRFIFLFFVNE